MTWNRNGKPTFLDPDAVERSDNGAQMQTDVRTEIVALLPRLRRYAFAQTRSVQDADDLVQSACVRALAHLDQFQPGTSLDSWMLKIVRTTWIDHVRYRARRPEVGGTEFAESLPFDDRISERTEARSDLERLGHAMMNLPDDQRDVLSLVVIDGRTYQEVADILDVPIGTVMSRLSRARTKLTKSLTKLTPSVERTNESKDDETAK